MFTPAERSRVREALVDAARDDPQVSAAALVGSVARGQEDRWSDIDLALRLFPGEDPAQLVESWTARMYGTYDAIAHTDLRIGPTIYRVFLLANSLQVDISWWPHDDFRPHGGPFQLAFGDAGEPSPAEPRSLEPMIGMGWLYALHARSSIARGRGLQALYMLNGMREQITSLLCLRAGLEADHARGADFLPTSMKDRLVTTLVRSLEPEELIRAFVELTTLLNEEIDRRSSTSTPLRAVLDEVVRSTVAQVSR